MWLKMTTDSDLSAQPTGYVNFDSGIVAQVVLNDVDAPYWAIQVANQQIDGTHYDTSDDAMAGLAALLGV
jgi:hypothetical protein